MLVSPHFDATASALGGALIACASIVFFLVLGRIMGVSGLLADAVSLTKTFGSSYVFIGAMILTAFAAVCVSCFVDLASHVDFACC